MRNETFDGTSELKITHAYATTEPRSETLWILQGADDLSTSKVLYSLVSLLA